MIAMAPCATPRCAGAPLNGEGRAWGGHRPSPNGATASRVDGLQALNEMLIIAGGILIAGAIAFVFFLGWTLTTARFASVLLRLLGLLLMAAVGALAFWLVFMRTGVLSWGDIVSIVGDHAQP